MSALIFFAVAFLAIGLVKCLELWEWSRRQEFEKGGTPMRVVITDGGRKAAGYTGKFGVGDCVTRALAVATGEPYADVYRTVEEFSRAERRRKPGRSSARRGVYPATMRKIMAHYGGVWTPAMGIGTGVQTHLRDGELPGGILIARLSGHVCAVIDGVVYDNGDPHRSGNRAVYGYWTFPERDGIRRASDVWFREETA